MQIKIGDWGELAKEGLPIGKEDVCEIQIDVNAVLIREGINISFNICVDQCYNTTSLSLIASKATHPQPFRQYYKPGRTRTTGRSELNKRHSLKLWEQNAPIWKMNLWLLTFKLIGKRPEICMCFLSVRRATVLIQTEVPQ